ncbi:MAG: hypothetical protein E6R06_26450 [Mycobacterium sp.]|nr:MAG: hypothetical protein E6R06_26450 [Mycobacterium sp.]
MSVKKPSTTTHDQVRSSVVRRPTGAAAAARAASTFQGSTTPAADPKPGAAATQLVTLHLVPAYHLSLRQRALTEDTSLTGLLSTAITACLSNPDHLAEASQPYYRAPRGADSQRTTALIDRNDHRTLKQLALLHTTSVQALCTAALTLTYPPK